MPGALEGSGAGRSPVLRIWRKDFAEHRRYKESRSAEQLSRIALTAKGVSDEDREGHSDSAGHSLVDGVAPAGSERLRWRVGTVCAARGSALFRRIRSLRPQSGTDQGLPAAGMEVRTAALGNAASKAGNTRYRVAYAGQVSRRLAFAVPGDC